MSMHNCTYASELARVTSNLEKDASHLVRLGSSCPITSQWLLSNWFESKGLCVFARVPQWIYSTEMISLSQRQWEFHKWVRQNLFHLKWVILGLWCALYYLPAERQLDLIPHCSSMGFPLHISTSGYANRRIMAFYSTFSQPIFRDSLCLSVLF